VPYKSYKETETQGRAVKTEFDNALCTMGAQIQKLFSVMPEEDKRSACEIRLRTGIPPSITDSSGRTISYGNERLTPYQVEEAFMHLCGHSVYSHTQELRNGFITVKGGHRAGFGARAVYDGDRLTGIREISSINLRIAREVIGCSTQLTDRVFCGGLCGLLVVGVPSSGKTTQLRDIARYLSESGRRVTVCDERGEIAAMCGCVSPFRLGRCCDVLTGFAKAEAMLGAVGCLNPQAIICDEIGSGEEVSALCEAVNAGACVIASVHASHEEELMKRPQCVKLLKTGAFKRVAFLPKKYLYDEEIKVKDAGDLIENHRSVTDRYMRSADRLGA